MLKVTEQIEPAPGVPELNQIGHRGLAGRAERVEGEPRGSGHQAEPGQLSDQQTLPALVPRELKQADQRAASRLALPVDQAQPPLGMQPPARGKHHGRLCRQLEEPLRIGKAPVEIRPPYGRMDLFNQVGFPSQGIPPSTQTPPSPHLANSQPRRSEAEPG